MIQSSYDVVVIGGGPAGSTVSTILADAGLKAGLFEREVFPRFHIGESLIPETYWVLKRIGMLPKMQASPFVKKHSVQFINASGKESAPFYFHDNKPHECSQTWQVIRSEFDQMLLENAREHGVDAHEGAHVTEVMFQNGARDGAPGDRAVGVKVKGRDGVRREVMAKVVVDASGQAALLQNKFKLRLWDPVLNKGAIWSYFEGAYRDEGRDEGATMVIQTPDRQGWFWYIPQHDNTVSVGVVAPFDYLFKRGAGDPASGNARKDHEKTFNEEVERTPGVKKRIESATRATGFFVTRDYSYRSKEAAGDGWVVIGDAFGFLDPLYSSGVLLALKSGELAADAIVDGLKKGETGKAQLGAWAPEFNKGIDRMRRLVCEYYDGFSFGKFVKKHPDLRGTITDLLIGDLFTDRVDKVWAPMEAMYPPGKQPIPAWFAGLDPDKAPEKANELILPEGQLR